MVNGYCLRSVIKIHKLMIGQKMIDYDKPIYTYYYLPETGSEEFEIHDPIEFQSNSRIFNYDGTLDEMELEWLVSDMGEDFSLFHNGLHTYYQWSKRPMIFKVYDDDQEFLGQFEVILHCEPAFEAHRIE